MCRKKWPSISNPYAPSYSITLGKIFETDHKIPRLPTGEHVGGTSIIESDTIM